MGSPGSPGSSGGKARAYLLLSLILLVWNTLAVARFAVRPVPPPGPMNGPGHPVTGCTPGGPVDEAGPVSARNAPLTLRQKYLLGNRMDINRATREEIAELPGISDPVARAVVAERNRRGGFRKPRELLLVPGIKEKRLEKILPFLAEMENN